MMGVLVNGAVKGMYYAPEPVTVRVLDKAIERDSTAAHCTHETEFGCARYETGTVTVFSISTDRGEFLAPFEIFADVVPGEEYNIVEAAGIISQAQPVR